MSEGGKRQNEEQAMDYLIYGASNKNELKKKSEISEQESTQEMQGHKSIFNQNL